MILELKFKPYMADKLVALVSQIWHNEKEGLCDQIEGTKK